MELTTHQIEQIEAWINAEGISIDTLQEDFLDHACTAIEQKLERGTQFTTAFEETKKEMASRGLLRYQKQLILWQFNKKFNPMKKFIYVVGCLATMTFVIGFEFKFMHWPYANLLMTTGISALVFGFFPMFFGFKIKEFSQIDKPEGKSHTLFGIVLAFAFSLGIFLKIMHLPAANILIVLSAFTCAFYFIPRWFYLGYKRSEEIQVSE